MNLPNAITIVRILLIPVFMWAMSVPETYARVLAIVIFVLASITDWVDGFLARRYHLVTNLGKFLDPLADKLLVTSALLMLMERGEVGAVPAMIIITREFLVTGLRMIAASEGVVIAAGMAGKIKTVIQIICISILLTRWAQFALWGFTLGWWLIFLMTAVTVWSGVQYLVQHRKLFNGGKQNGD